MNNYQFYKKNGYILFKNMYSKAECNEYLQLLKDCADKKFSVLLNVHREDFLISQNLKKINSLKNLVDKIDQLNKYKKLSKIFKNIFKKKKFISNINKLYKKEIVGLQTQVVFKKPKTNFGKQVYLPHQDNAYGKNKNGLFFSSHLFLENANIKNGTIYVYKGSHSLGLQKIDTYRKGYNENKFAGHYVNIREIKNTFKKVDINAKAGDILVIHGNIFHGSYENKTKKKSRTIISLHGIPKHEEFFVGNTARRKIFYLK